MKNVKKLKKSEFWDENQENTCGYCQHGKVMHGCDQVICQKRKNLFAFSHTCRKFKFDILKKDVRRQRVPDFQKFSKEQFEL